MPANRRHFSRIFFQTEARLYLSGQEVDVQVIDLSLKGALVETTAPLIAIAGSRCILRIRLDEMGTLISMDCQIAHREGQQLGLRCREIDLDSVTHLRRLVELNLGDASILNRELSALTGAD